MAVATPIEETHAHADTGAPSEGRPTKPKKPQSRIAQRKAWILSMPKPAARGWIHAITAPLALANALTLMVLAPTAPLRAACLVYALASVMLFGNSAVYHLGKWSVKVHSVLRRIDHSNIFLLIAGTYTPITAALLPGKLAALVLVIVWVGALGGILMSVLAPNAPRPVYVPFYVALGWVALWFLPQFWATGGPAVVWLLVAGGLCYTLGALCYAFRWPNPWPRAWGFHEFFHTGTLLGYSCHAVAIWLAVFA